MENQASTLIQGTQGTQVFPILDIRIPTDEDIKEYNREKEERRQKALERLRNENMALPRTPSVPRPTNPVGWESLGPKKN